MNFDVSLIATSLPKILHGLGLTLNPLVVSTLIGLGLPGGIPLMLTTLGFTLLGEKLRDVLDPKLQVRRA